MQINATSSTSSGRLYPLARPDHDSRFSFGLLLDIAEILGRHGYPRFTDSADLVHLQQGLYQTLYATAGELR